MNLANTVGNTDMRKGHGMTDGVVNHGGDTSEPDFPPTVVDEGPFASLRFQQIDHKATCFQEYLRQRNAAFEMYAAPDERDHASEHYVAVLDDSVIAGLRVTRASVARLEFESHLPPTLLVAYRDKICNAARMFVCKSTALDRRLLRLHLIAAAWKSQLELGSRLDVIAASTRTVPLFARMGYMLIADAPFTHALRDSACWPMCFPASPKRQTSLNCVFQGTTKPLEAEDVSSTTRVFDWKHALRSFRHR